MLPLPGFYIERTGAGGVQCLVDAAGRNARARTRREISIMFTGQVTKTLAIAVSKVERFNGNGSILTESPASLGLSSENAKEADCVRFWKVHADAGQTD